MNFIASAEISSDARLHLIQCSAWFFLLIFHFIPNSALFPSNCFLFSPILFSLMWDLRNLLWTSRYWNFHNFSVTSKINANFRECDIEYICIVIVDLAWVFDLTLFFRSNPINYDISTTFIRRFIACIALILRWVCFLQKWYLNVMPSWVSLVF